MTSFRIFEIILYSCLNLLPYLGLALYPFADKLRFSKVKVGLFIFLLLLVSYKKYFKKILDCSHL